MNIKQRLRQAILLKNKTLKQFALESGMPYITLQQYLSDKIDRKPNADALIKMSIYLNVSLDWLLTGEGAMYRDHIQEERVENKKAVEQIVEWLKDWWDKANEKERYWLEVQIERTFPEYREWLKKQGL
jgi:transcriptional regulator with XRE-family HTH domain